VFVFIKLSNHTQSEISGENNRK